MIEAFFSQLTDSSIAQFSKLDNILDGNLHPEVINYNIGHFIQKDIN
jgi:hypothetical protein